MGDGLTLETWAIKYREIADIPLFFDNYRRLPQVRRTSTKALFFSGSGLLGMKELRWCRVLCWLLETSSGAAGATELQQRICSLARVDDHVSFSAIGREITEGDSRYDVVLVGQDLDLVIEAKVNAPSDMNQLDQYRQAFLKGTKKFAGLFLTKKKEKPDNWESATWCELAEVLEDICLSNKDNEGRADRMWNLIANDFAIYIKTMTS